MHKVGEGFSVPAGIRYLITYTCDLCGYEVTIQNKRGTYPTGWKVGKGFDHCPTCSNS